MAIRVDLDGDGLWDLELNDPSVNLNQITDLTGDTKLDVDLRTQNSTAVINGATFGGGIINAGTGGFNDFLGMQNNPNEFGFNSSVTNDPSNPYLKTSTNFTHTIKLSDIAITTINGVQYYDFRLDVNESNATPTTQQISLDSFKLYTSLDGTIGTLSALQAQNLVYDMDQGGGVNDVSVLFTDAFSSGSGRSDLSVLIPVSQITVAPGHTPADTYLYLYSAFGFAGTNYNTDATFEEWRTQDAVILHGIKFNDGNGNGSIDGTDSTVKFGISGLTINLYEDTNKSGVLDVGDQLLQTTVTDANGNYNFYGVKTNTTYFVDEVTPAGWTQTTGNYETVIVSSNATAGSTIQVDPIGNFNPIDLSGTKYLDTNGNGVVDAGELGKAGVTIFIDMDNSGTFNGGDLSTVTASNGTWSFSNLAASVIGHKVLEVVPSGYVQTLGVAGYTINGDATGLNFANFEKFDISGTKYTDTNGNGVVDAGELGLAGVTVFIDKDGSGTLTAGDLSTVTAADGTWSFTGLGTGYAGKMVFEVLPSGYVQTLGSAGYAITGTSGADQTGLNFANFEKFDISGTKYTDTNGNGVVDAGELGLAGVTVFIDKDGSGTLTAGDLSTVTAADGTWSFTGLGTGYAGKMVFEVLPSGYVQTLGSAGYAITGTSGADQTGLNFANFEKFDISGTKYTDTNGNGVVDAGELGLAGVTVFIDKDGSGTLTAGDLSTVTAADGTWSFTGLGTGYAGKMVFEVLPSGYVQTLGSAGYAITGTSGADQTGLNFANFEKFDISGTKYNDLTGNGLTADDTGMGGVTVFIDKDGSGTLTAGDLSTVTAADGTWSFTGLGTGYAGKMVFEVLPSGWVQTLGNAGYAITGTSGTDQTGLNFANFLPDPHIGLTKYVMTDQSGGFQDANDPNGPIASTSTTVEFKVTLSNTGNVALNAIHLSDSVIHTVNGVPGAPQTIDYNDPTLNAWVDLNHDGSQNAGEAWITLDANHDGTLDSVTLAVGGSLDIHYSLTSLLGQHENTAVVTATATLGGASVTDNDDANYYVLPSVDCVGVGTPGFWANNGNAFWDGIAGNEKHVGDPNVKGDSDPGFADGELLYAVDSNHDGVANGSDAKGLLIGDYNHNGITDAGEDTLFISLADANTLINASQKQQQDAKYMLGRDMVATWLNYLANGGAEGDTSCIDRPGTADDGFSPQHYLNDAIDWMQQFASNQNSNSAGQNLLNNYHSGDTQATFQIGDAAIKTSAAAWQSAFQDIDHSGSNIHSSLDAYNNTGVINGVEFCCDRDNSDALFAIQQIA